MKACSGSYCNAVVSNYKRLCDVCLDKAFQARARKTTASDKIKVGSAKRGSKTKAPVSKSEVLPDSDRGFVDDSPRFAKSYEAQYMDNARDALRNTGRTTALALQALSIAIAQRGRITYAEDHYPGRSGQTALMARIESIALAIGWALELQPEQGTDRVQLISRYVPPKVWGL